VRICRVKGSGTESKQKNEIRIRQAGEGEKSPYRTIESTNCWGGGCRWADPEQKSRPRKPEPIQEHETAYFAQGDETAEMGENGEGGVNSDVQSEGEEKCQRTFGKTLLTS